MAPGHWDGLPMAVARPEQQPQRGECLPSLLSTFLVWSPAARETASSQLSSLCFCHQQVDTQSSVH